METKKVLLALTGPFHCEMCAKEFQSNWGIRRHYKNKHHVVVSITQAHTFKVNMKIYLAEDGPFGCNICDTHSDTITELKAHYQKKHDTNVSITQRDNNMETKEVILPMNGPFQCEMCDNQCGISKIRLHYKENHHVVVSIKQRENDMETRRLTLPLKGPFLCDVCDKQNKTTAGLRHHYKKKHRVVVSIKQRDNDIETRPRDSKMERRKVLVPEYGPVQCEICNWKGVRTETLRNHYLNTHKVRISLEKAGFFKDCSTKDTMQKKEVFLALTPPFQCDMCAKSFQTTSSLSLHYRFKHNHRASIKQRGNDMERRKVLVPEYGPLQCDICNWSGVTACALRNHYLHTHKVRITTKQPQHGMETRTVILPLQGPFRCELCNSQFTMKNALRNHYNWLHSTQAHIKTTKDRQTARVQVKLEPTGPYKCTICNKIVSHDSNLREHYETKHNLIPEISFTEQPKIRRNKCPRVRKSIDDVIKYHQSCLCAICGAILKNGRRLLLHTRLRHPTSAAQKNAALKLLGLKGLRIAHPEVEEFDANTIQDAVLGRGLDGVNIRKTRGVYIVVVVPQEAKDIGLYNYLKNNEKDPSIEAFFYVGKSRSGKPSPYHTDKKRSHTSSIARAIQPHLKRVAFLGRTIKFRTTAENTCQEKAAIAEGQFQNLLYAYNDQEEKPNRMKWTMLNKRMESVDMSAEQELASVTLGTYKIPLLVVDSALTEDMQLEDDCGFSLKDFAFGESFFHILKEDEKFVEIPYVHPTLPFPVLEKGLRFSDF